MSTEPSLDVQIAPDALPRVLSPAHWQAVCRLHADLEQRRAQLAQACAAHQAQLAQACDEAAGQAAASARERVAVEMIEAVGALRRAARTQTPELVRLMFATLEKMLGEQPALSVTPKLAAKALSTQIDAQIVVGLRVHPQVRDAVVAHLDGWAQRQQRAPVEVHADDTLTPTDCDIETVYGRLRAGLAAQLAVLEKALIGAPESGPA